MTRSNWLIWQSRDKKMFASGRSGASAVLTVIGERGDVNRTALDFDVQKVSDALSLPVFEPLRGIVIVR